MKENDPNWKGLIYYGTDYKYIEDLDKNGLKKPRHKDEQFISICISGYESKSKCEHAELKEFARVYTEELKIAKLNNGCLFYKNGYINSMTCLDGFGPSPNKYYNCIYGLIENTRSNDLLTEELKIAELNNGCLFYKNGYINSMTCLEGFGPSPNKYLNSIYGLIENTRSNDLLTVVLSEKAEKYLVFPNKEREFEHLSLSLHSFIAEINPDFIIGWIVAEENINELKSQMANGKIKNREIWSINDFQILSYDINHRARYGFTPFDLSMYLENLDTNNMYSFTCKEHLKNILQELIPNEYNWNEKGNVLKSEIQNWWDINKEKVIWDKNKFRYKWK